MRRANLKMRCGWRAEIGENLSVSEDRKNVILELEDKRRTKNQKKNPATLDFQWVTGLMGAQNRTRTCTPRGTRTWNERVYHSATWALISKPIFNPVWNSCNCSVVSPSIVWVVTLAIARLYFRRLLGCVSTGIGVRWRPWGFCGAKVVGFSLFTKFSVPFFLNYFTYLWISVI